MNDFFKQLGDEMKKNPYRDRFLAELEDHADDLMEEEEKNQMEFTFLEKHFGKPRQIKKDFSAIIGPWFLVWLFFKRHALLVSFFLFIPFLMMFGWDYTESCWSMNESEFNRYASKSQLYQSCKNNLFISLFEYFDLDEAVDLVFSDVRIIGFAENNLSIENLEFCYEKRPEFFRPFQPIEYYYRPAGSEGSCDIAERAESLFSFGFHATDFYSINGDPSSYWQGFEKESFGRGLAGYSFPTPIFFLIQYLLLFGSLKFFFTYLKRRSRK